MSYRINALSVLIIAVTAVMGISCTSEKEKANESTSPFENIVEVSAVDYAFEAPEEIASGWTTFRFTNEGNQEHFLYIYRLPDDKTYDQFLEEAMVPFGSVWEEYASGKLNREEAGAKFAAELPGWFFTGIVPSGGPALTEPGETSQATVKLEPGTHVIECYVKMPDGRWHTEMGMQQMLTVTEEASDAQAPTADVELFLSNYEITTNGQLQSGEQTVAVKVEERPEGFMQHDINLFRLDDGTSADSIVAWMDWMDMDQFRAPAPGYSIGGLEHMAAGNTGYITVDLQPGDYAWVSEGYGNRGMVETFSIE